MSVVTGSAAAGESELPLPIGESVGVRGIMTLILFCNPSPAAYPNSDRSEFGYADDLSLWER
jgi:hypothetical protein